MDLSVVLQLLVAGSGWQFPGDCGMFMMIYIYIMIFNYIYIRIYEDHETISVDSFTQTWHLSVLWVLLVSLMRLLDNYRHSYVVVWCVEVLVIHVYSTISPHINGQDTKFIFAPKITQDLTLILPSIFLMRLQCAGCYLCLIFSFGSTEIHELLSVRSPCKF